MQYTVRKNKGKGVFGILCMLLLAPACMIFLSSCSTISGSIPTIAIDTRFRTGTEGISLEVEGPSELIAYENETATFPETYVIKLENRGAYAVDPTTFYLKIKPGKYLSISDKYGNSPEVRLLDFKGDILAVDSFEGKTLYSKKGDNAEYTLNLIGAPPPSSSSDSSLNVEMCYAYRTLLSASICLNTRTHKENEGCKDKDYSYSEGEGAPIAVSNIEVKEAFKEGKSKPVLILTLSNDEGDLFSYPAYDEACKGQKIGMNRLKLYAKMGSKDLKCNVDSDGTVEIKNSEKKVICETFEPVEDTPLGYFTTAVYVQLDYGYHKLVEQEISMERHNYDDE